MAYGYINQQALPYAFLKSQLWNTGLSQGRDHFDVLNQHLSRGLVRPGELVIVPEAPAAHCTIEEAWLMRLWRRGWWGVPGWENYREQR